MSAAPPWLDDEAPHEPAHSRAQLDALASLLDPPPRRILDLGCGVGRVLIPLAAAGHRLVGVDRNEAALSTASARLREGGLNAELLQQDFSETEALPDGPFDAVLCLGNTFMTIAVVDVAVDLLRRCAQALAPGGVVIVDDMPEDFWPEMTGGFWQSGLSPDEDAQLVWSDTDAVFAIRMGDEIDEACWELRDGDRRLRLWTDGTLRLAAQAAGLAAPERVSGAHLLELRLGGRGGEGSR